MVGDYFCPPIDAVDVIGVGTHVFAHAVPVVVVIIPAQGVKGTILLKKFISKNNHLDFLIHIYLKNKDTVSFDLYFANIRTK